MAVAKNQIQELLEIIMKYVPQEQVRPMLHDLMKTAAYKRNRSYATTIDRLWEVTS